MKKRLTLKKNFEFRRLYRKGATAAGGCMVVYCMRNRLGRSRLGLTASTKLGNAVKRNRARRRLREVFRLNLAALKPGYDVILVARGRTLSASWKELNSTFLRLCRKLGMAKETPDNAKTADSAKTPDSAKRPDSAETLDSAAASCPPDPPPSPDRKGEAT